MGYASRRDLILRAAQTLERWYDKYNATYRKTYPTLHELEELSSSWTTFLLAIGPVQTKNIVDLYSPLATLQRERQTEPPEAWERINAKVREQYRVLHNELSPLQPTLISGVECTSHRKDPLNLPGQHASQL